MRGWNYHAQAAPEAAHTRILLGILLQRRRRTRTVVQDRLERRCAFISTIGGALGYDRNRPKAADWRLCLAACPNQMKVVRVNIVLARQRVLNGVPR